MKKLILVKGIKNSGKSTVIMNACAQYLNGSNEFFPLKAGNDANVYVDKRNKKMGFASGGDDPTTVKKNIKFFSSCGCEIGVSALNTSNPDAEKAWPDNLGSNIFDEIKEIKEITSPKDETRQKEIIGEIIDELK